MLSKMAMACVPVLDLIMPVELLDVRFWLDDDEVFFISIPRLKEQATTLSVKIYRVLIGELSYEIRQGTFWSDSQTTLQYIKTETKRYQTLLTIV